MKTPQPASKIAGEQIRAFRRTLGWSLETLAGKVGLTRKGMSKIERGDVSSGVDRYEAISKALGVPLADLFVGSAPRPRRGGPRSRGSRSVSRVSMARTLPRSPSGS